MSNFKIHAPLPTPTTTFTLC